MKTIGNIRRLSRATSVSLALSCVVLLWGSWGCGDFRYFSCETNDDCGTDSSQRRLRCACDRVCRASCDENKPCLEQEACKAGFCIHKDEPDVVLGTACEDPKSKGVCNKGIYVCARNNMVCRTSEFLGDEKCDGKDNDCDGLVDEDLSQSCTNLCGFGRSVCKKGEWGACDALDSRPCRSSNASCQDGVEFCTEGRWTGVCKGEIVKEPERCDGKDNDCDGAIDESLDRVCKNDCGTGVEVCQSGKWTPCDAQNSRACGTNEGECRGGIETCSKGKWSGQCVGATSPTNEVCDNKDNNCNGAIDELWPNKFSMCSDGLGACRDVNVWRCAPDGRSVVCPAKAKSPTVEVCDGKDNDCDGVVDEGLERPCTNVCGKGKEVCASGRWLPCDAVDSRVCNNKPGFCSPGAELCQWGRWGTCEGSVAGKPELCDGIDNNCDGRVDELWPVDSRCFTSGQGECRLEGKFQCTLDQKGAECSVKTPGKPQPEICDWKDNDCDGKVDNVKPYVLSGHSKAVYSVASSASYLASGSGDGTIQLVDVRTRKLHKSMQHGGVVYTVAFSPNGQLLASGGADKTVKLWDPTTGRLIQTLQGHTGGVTTLAFDRTGNLLASGSSDKSIRIWNTKTFKLLDTLNKHTGTVRGVSFGLYGKLLASGGADKIGKSWNLPKSISYDFWKQGQEITNLVFHPQGATLLVGFANGSIRTYSAVDLDVKSYRFAEMKQTYVNASAHSSVVWGLSYDSAGWYFATSSSDRTVRVWGALSRKLVHTLQGHTGTVRSVAFLPLSYGLASGSDDGTVRIWHCLKLSQPSPSP